MKELHRLTFTSLDTYGEQTNKLNALTELVDGLLWRERQRHNCMQLTDLILDRHLGPKAPGVNVTAL